MPAHGRVRGAPAGRREHRSLHVFYEMGVRRRAGGVWSGGGGGGRQGLICAAAQHAGVGVIISF